MRTLLVATGSKNKLVELQRLFPALRELFPNLPELPESESEEAQFRRTFQNGMRRLEDAVAALGGAKSLAGDVAFVDRFTNSGYFDVTATVTNYDDVRRLMDAGRINAAIQAVYREAK